MTELYETDVTVEVSASAILDTILGDPKLASRLYEAIRTKALQDSRNKGNLWQRRQKG